MKRVLWLGVVITLLVGNVVGFRLYSAEKARTQLLLVEQAQQVHANLHVASIHIQKITTPDAPEAQFWIQLTARNLAEAETGLHQLTGHLLDRDSGSMRTMARHIQRIYSRLQSMAWSKDYTGLPEVREAVEMLAGHLDGHLNMDDRKTYLAQFRDLINRYESPYPGLR
ncbi:MAG TPA: hypothetical protein VNT75_15805 [Symbiobacteriaceae bacterium]|nr:hypothetical protein [Symbiobacteriaceae bacterium]